MILLSLKNYWDHFLWVCGFGINPQLVFAAIMDDDVKLPTSKRHTILDIFFLDL